MKTTLLALAICVGAVTADAQSTRVDASYRAAGILPFTVGDKVVFRNMVAYRFFNDGGQATFCAALGFVSLGSDQNAGFFARALPRAQVRIGDSVVRRGLKGIPRIGVAPKVSRSRLQAEVARISQMPQGAQKTAAIDRLEGSIQIPHTKASTLEGQPVRCYRTRIKWQDGLEDTPATIDMPQQIITRRKLG